MSGRTVGALLLDGSRYRFASEADSPVLRGCRCLGCAALRVEYGADSQRLLSYGKLLLVKGWGGHLSDAERAYVRAHAAWAQPNAGTAALQNARRAQEVPPPDHLSTGAAPLRPVVATAGLTAFQAMVETAA